SLDSPGALRHLPSFPTRRSSDLARVFDEAGRELGIGGFLAVRDEAKGLRVVRREKTMGLRGMPEGELAFENLEVPNGMAVLPPRSEEHTSELQSRGHLVCRLLLE